MDEVEIRFPPQPPRFQVGDRVVKNPTTWKMNAFDSWGRGVGVGVVVEPPFSLAPDEVDVRWPAGRCFEDADGLLPAEPVMSKKE